MNSKLIFLSVLIGCTAGKISTTNGDQQNEDDSLKVFN